MTLHDTTLTDPVSLRDRDDVDVADVTHDVPAADFPDAADLDSHVVVGVAGGHGVLLQHDGHHGWTLPAFPVADGDDWLAVAREEFAALTGVGVDLTEFERARRVRYRDADGDAATSIWTVVVRADPVYDLPPDPESRVDGVDIQWFDAPPEDAPDAVADDVRLVLDGRA